MKKNDNLWLFVPIKENSVRVPRKNFNQLGDKPLYINVLNRYSDAETEIHVDTDSDEVIRGLSGYKNIVTHRRSKELIGDDVSVNKIIKNFTDKIIDHKDLWIAQIHVTSPFLKPETIFTAYNTAVSGGYDSCVSCNVHQTRFWRKEEYGFCPINHNPAKLEKTQDLPKYYEENSAFYIFNVSMFRETGRRVGENPLFYEVGYPENLDIDTMEDWERAKDLYKNMEV